MTNQKPGETDSGRSRTGFAIRERIPRVDWRVKGTQLLLMTCVLVLAGMLVVGLWPFHSPRNQVTWLGVGNGLQIRRHGVILSSGRFRAPDNSPDGPCSLEIWFEPTRTWDSASVLSFYAPERRRQFSLLQSLTDLRLQSDLLEEHYQTLSSKLDVANVFWQGRPAFVTITAKGGQTSVYLNGAPVVSSASFQISSRDFAGRLIIGNPPRAGETWRGQVRGLAVYDDALPPAQVRQDFETWSRKGRPEISAAERPVALYLFDEHAGSAIHNQVPGATDLSIPDHYVIVDQAFLRPFWVEYDPTRGYWEGVILFNVVGFVPLGFLFCAYFSLSGRIHRPALATVLVGFALSLTIECLQAFLPTRDSGTTDLITNTLGTCIGIWIYRWSFWKVWSARIWRGIVGL